MNGLPPFETHRVENQPPAFEPRDLWADDIALREAVDREGGAAFAARLAVYGALAGDELSTPTAIARACARMIASVIASTRWNSIRPITG